MRNIILFDLDGTLLPMDQDKFLNSYMSKMATYMAPYGFDPKILHKAMWSGVGAMVKNDGSLRNEDLFWHVFSSFFDKEMTDLAKKITVDFYKTEFQKVADDCGYTPKAKEIIGFLKEKGYQLVLATNPLFPAIATESRMRWAGLTPEDFKYYTVFENSRFCKPNLKYYEEILEKIGCKAEECYMVGNDVSEDMITEELGMEVFLLTHSLINKENKDLSKYPQGDFEELKAFFDSKL